MTKQRHGTPENVYTEHSHFMQKNDSTMNSNEHKELRQSNTTATRLAEAEEIIGNGTANNANATLQPTDLEKVSGSNSPP